MSLLRASDLATEATVVVLAVAVDPVQVAALHGEAQQPLVQHVQVVDRPHRPRLAPAPHREREEPQRRGSAGTYIVVRMRQIQM